MIKTAIYISMQSIQHSMNVSYNEYIHSYEAQNQILVLKVTVQAWIFVDEKLINHVVYKPGQLICTKSLKLTNCWLFILWLTDLNIILNSLV